jgi:hypothetical protein
MVERVEETGIYHKAFFDSLKNCVTAFHSTVPADEMLAIVSQLIGNLTEVQDKTIYNQNDIKATIDRNIQLGILQHRVLTNKITSIKMPT